MTDAERAVIRRAGALLLDAAGMLRLEAEEWRTRKNDPPSRWNESAKAWGEKCDRIAATNVSAATSMDETAKKIAALVQP